MDRGALPISSLDPHMLSFPGVAPERLEIKSEKEEANAEHHVTPISGEIVTFVVDAFPSLFGSTVVICEKALEVCRFL
ncbi:hypothetical protein FKM82_030683 [Ascaphus truei]